MSIDNKVKESRLEEFITDPKKALWKLSMPMMFGMSVQAIYMMADTAFLGHMIGGTALASLGYVFPYFFILMGITFGLGSGATTVIAQFIGKKDSNRNKKRTIAYSTNNLNCLRIFLIIFVIYDFLLRSIKFQQVILHF